MDQDAGLWLWYLHPIFMLTQCLKKGLPWTLEAWLKCQLVVYTIYYVIFSLSEFGKFNAKC